MSGEGPMLSQSASGEGPMLTQSASGEGPMLTQSASGEGAMQGQSASGEGQSQVRVVLVTAPDAEVAGRIARTLVEERLVACVNVIERMRSVYRWQGAVEEESEQLLVMKTRADRCPALAARVEALHPYELPEVLVLPVSGGSQRYLDWVSSESSE